MTEDLGLSAVSLPDLERLARAIDTAELACPPSDAGLLAAGLDHLRRHLGLLGDLDRRASSAVVAAVLAERRRHGPSDLELVWTGPEATASAARDTWVVVRELFGQARTSVLVGGFRIDHGAELLRPLYEAMVERGVEATFVLDVPGRADFGESADAFAARELGRVLAENWPFGEPRPALFYDPRTAAAGSVASMHAKCIVVDRRVVLVTSANFTDRGHTRNIELGVVVRDEGFARRVEGQWQGLIDQRLVTRYAQSGG